MDMVWYDIGTFFWWMLVGVTFFLVGVGGCGWMWVSVGGWVWVSVGGCTVYKHPNIIQSWFLAGNLNKGFVDL